MPGWLRLMGCLLTAAALGGCATDLGEFAATPPNDWFGPSDASLSPGFLADLAGIDDQLLAPVELNGESIHLACQIMDPPDDQPIRGTVFILHGIYVDSVSMIPYADHLRDAGFRAVMVDLPGQGGSTGGPLGYGVHEATALDGLLDYFEKENRVVGRVGVLGISYGATCAIHWAGADPRVEAVVAIAGFSDMWRAIDDYLNSLGLVVGMWLDADDRATLYAAALKKAGLTDTPPDTVAALKKTDAPVLIMHGTWDLIVPVDHGRRLAAALGGNGQAIFYDGRTHATIWLDLDGAVRDRSSDWLLTHLTDTDTTPEGGTP